MRLYAFYTPSHEILKNEWFLPSLKDDYELKIEKYDQECPTGNYKKQGWVRAMLRKAEIIVHAIKDNCDGMFIYSDVDIQFFKPTQDLSCQLMKRKDLALQRDSPEGGLCAGFFICRANWKTLKLWEDICRFLAKSDNRDDQDVLNDFLLTSRIVPRMLNRLVEVFDKNKQWAIHCRPHFSNSYGIKWRYLPMEFFGGGTLTGKQWTPGTSLVIPRNIVLHHANWTVGLENKIAQLQYVRNIAMKHN